MGGDFNAYLHSDEKKGGKWLNRKRMEEFNDCVQDCELMDMGVSSRRFTWKGGNILERIDIFLYKVQRQSCFADAFVKYFFSFKSDHCPILLDLGVGNKKKRGDIPFRFVAAWLLNDSFKGVVKGSWKDRKVWREIVDDFVVRAMAWNKKIFGNIFHKKKILQARLRGTQWKLDEERNPYLEN